MESPVCVFPLGLVLPQVKSWDPDFQREEERPEKEGDKSKARHCPQTLRAPRAETTFADVTPTPLLYTSRFRLGGQPWTTRQKSQVPTMGPDLSEACTLFYEGQKINPLA